MSDFATRPARRARSAASSRAALELVRAVLGDESPVHVTFPDGSTHGPPDAAMRITIRSTDAFAHMLRAPGELGLARAYVSGAIDVDGDIGVAIALQERIENTGLAPLRPGLSLVRSVGIDALRNPPPAPPEEIAPARRRGLRRHTKARDASSISHHYDVSNDFYRLVLGPSMTYSCAAYSSDDDSLEQAQQNKYELVCRKLDLAPGKRLLDVGCGWGSMVIHAAKHHGVQAVGVTISREQYAYARQAVVDAGLEDRVEIRLQDYREIADGPFDAISSIGMFEHVGLSRTEEYLTRLKGLLRVGGRLLNHQIGRPPGNVRFGRERTDLNPRGFVQRYVFPDGELLQVGTLANAMQEVGFEVRHIESLREHYARTLRFWGQNLEDNWTRAATLVGEGRARVWKLYMAGSAVLFDTNKLQIHQVLAVNVPARGGPSGLSWRPTWEHRLTTPGNVTTAARADADGTTADAAEAARAAHADAGDAAGRSATERTVIDLRDPTSTV